LRSPCSGLAASYKLVDILVERQVLFTVSVPKLFSEEETQSGVVENLVESLRV
jgi:hypothetical protein